ncbi:MAG TPA: 50S ribosomal protein L3 [Ktedonobacterales bacterium]|nr:50S ribosomal protein L3 [Ktedonobacterales bacterium]
MLSGMLGRKVGMTQIFGANGAIIPVTIIEAGPCTVTQVKTESRDGYEAVQLGFDTIEAKRATRPMLGHLGHELKATERQRRDEQRTQQKARQAARQKKQATEAEADQAESAEETEAGATTTAPAKRGAKRRGGAGKALGPFKVLREVKVVGDLPAVGEEVDIIGTSKGKGFAGVMKRHGFHGGQRTHGQSDRARAPGSIGPGTTPGRVYKGTRMAGRMGNERVTVKALRIVQADPERNLLVVQGSVPGANGGLLVIRKSAVQMAVAARQQRG